MKQGRYLTFSPLLFVTYMYKVIYKNLSRSWKENQSNQMSAKVEPVNNKVTNKFQNSVTYENLI